MNLSTAKYTLVSLFSGCGGFDLGFEGEGFKATAAFDIDHAAVDAYNQNIRPIARMADLAISSPHFETPDIVIAGSPCQGFSTSGKRIANDPRNHLLVHAARIALGARPKAIILENVPAAIAGSHRGHWECVENMIRWSGYHTRRFVADGPSSGVPQIRRRLFLIAWQGSEHRQIRLAEHPGGFLDEVLAGVDELADHDPQLLADDTREGMIAAHIPEGKKLCNVRISDSSIHTWDIPEVFGRVTRREREILSSIIRLRRRDRRRNFGDADPVTPATVSRHLRRSTSKDIVQLISKGYLRRVGRYVDIRHTYNGKFRRLLWRGHSPTVDTHFGDPCLFLHPKENRGLTPREAARIQGFPDWFWWDVSRRARYRLIGNAVPPPMGARLASFVRQALLQ